MIMVNSMAGETPTLTTSSTQVNQMDTPAAHQMDTAGEHTIWQYDTFGGLFPAPGTPGTDDRETAARNDRTGADDSQLAAPNPPGGRNVPAAERCLREPTLQECEAFKTLEDILNWARVPGDPAFPPSAAARFLELTGCMDDGNLDATIEDFASLTPTFIDTTIADWRYHKCHTREAYEEQLGTYVESATEYTEIPSPMLITRVRMAHNAARIKARVIMT